MDAATLNRKLAEALGWVVVDHEMFTADPCELWLDLKTGHTVCTVADFSPATDPNHLRLYVYPELKRRGVKSQWCHTVVFSVDGDGYDDLWCMANASPSVLAAAALKCLEASK